MRLAVIPARGGSKRIPRKNIREFCGKPLIAYSIDAAVKSGCFDRIVVSTDDPEVADVAKEWGAEVPFMRPAELSGDDVATAPVIAHAIFTLMHGNSVPRQVCCIYATAPLLQAASIREGLLAMERESSEFAFSVATYPYPIQRALKRTHEGRITLLATEHHATRSQDLEEAWHDAGQFYWGLATAWLEQKPIFSEHSVPVVLDRWRVQDIDTPEDWEMAELLYMAQQVRDNTTPAQQVR